MKIEVIKSTSDIDNIVHSFSQIGWNKPHSLFERYLHEQDNRERVVWLAFEEDQFAGYITLKWESLYPSFKENNIPEIMDLNVLPKFRCKGIGSALLHIAEQEAFKKYKIVGIGVGLSADYGSAQKLYIKNNYIPDGLGITYQYKRVEHGQSITLDDDLVLWFTKGVAW